MSAVLWIRIAALLGGLSVAAGAFGAHSLKEKLEPRMLENFQTGATYQMTHALALLAVGILLSQSSRPSTALSIAAWSFLIGIMLFSGSLYALALSGITKLGAITPLGGVAFLVGWVALAVGATRTGS